MKSHSRNLAQKVGGAAKWLAGELGLEWGTGEPSTEVADAESPPQPEDIASRHSAELAELAGKADDAKRSAWRALIEAHQGKGENLNRIGSLSKGLAKLGRTVPPQLLEDLLALLADATADESFLAAAGAFATQSGHDAFLLGLARRVHDPDAAAAAIDLGAFLASQGRGDLVPDTLLDLLARVPNRIAVKRYETALKLLAEHQSHVDVADPFVVALIEEDPDWLKVATTELGLSGRAVDRLALVRLRDWAPDSIRLGRYFRAIHALAEAGLSLDDSEKLVHPRLDDENQIATLCQIGRLGSLIQPFSVATAADLLETLPDPASVHRYAQALELLSELALSARDVEALAPVFATSPEDVLWLEAYVTRASADHFMASRLEIMRVHERCPEVAQLYRFLHIGAQRDHFSAAARPVITSIAFEASLSKEATERVVKQLYHAIGDGTARSATPADLLVRYEPIRRFVLKLQGPLP